jgi:hypothetical protein
MRLTETPRRVLRRSRTSVPRRSIPQINREMTKRMILRYQVIGCHLSSVTTQRPIQTSSRLSTSIVSFHNLQHLPARHKDPISSFQTATEAFYVAVSSRRPSHLLARHHDPLVHSKTPVHSKYPCLLAEEEHAALQALQA